MFQIPTPLTEDALGKMMERDEYWDDNHPDYKPLRDTVQAGYKKLYGGQQKVPLADKSTPPSAPSGKKAKRPGNTGAGRKPTPGKSPPSMQDVFTGVSGLINRWNPPEPYTGRYIGGPRK